MNDTPSIQLAARMFSGLAAVGLDPQINRVLSEDPYVFASYMAALNPVLMAINQDKTAMRNPKAHELFQTFETGLEEKFLLSAAARLDERDSALKMINELKEHIGAQLTAGYASQFIAFTEVYKNNALNIDRLIQLASSVVLDYIADDDRTAYSTNLRWLQKLLGLTQSEINLVIIATLQTVDPGTNIFLRYIEHAIPGRADLLETLALSTIFDRSAVHKRGADVTEKVLEAKNALDSATSKPLAFGLASYSSMSKRFSAMSNFWVSVLFKEYDDATEFYEEFLEEATERESASGALARMEPKDKELIDKLVESVKADTKTAKGCNVLCYGSRRFDKRSVVFTALQCQVDGVYELRQRGVGDRDLPSVAWVAQAYLKKLMEDSSKFYVLLVERAENVVSRSVRRSSLMYDLFGSDISEKKDDREHLDSDEFLLTEGATLTFWLTNVISQLNEDAVGRFLAHIEIKGGTRADRKAEVEKVAKELKLSDNIVTQLSKYSELGSHQVRSAASLATRLHEDGEQGEARIIAAVESSQKALNRTKTEELRESVTKYDLSLLNLSGKFSIEKIVKALQRKPSGTMCFYGLPGTGKTQLAEYLAVQIDKPLLIKRASDIFSMWLGESEKKVKEMFEEGIAEDAMILLDEADSFMRDRSRARASWEVSIVNELLTRMERYPGVFVCATNLFEALDAAALRRFTFKLQFHSLLLPQRIQMFENETGVKLSASDDGEKAEWLQTLEAIKYLTPGDFATVKRQSNLLGETLGPEEWLEQLHEESKAKLQGIKSMGLSEEEAFIAEQMLRSKGTD